MSSGLRQLPVRPRRLVRVGRAVYLLLVQSLVGVMALGLFVYLAVNSPSFPTILSSFLSDLLPGTLRVHAVNLGPSPGHVVLQRLRIEAPNGETVLAAGRIEATLAWTELVHGLVSGQSLVLHFNDLQLHHPVINLDQDAQGQLLLPQAFVDPNEPPNPKPGMPMRLAVDEVHVTNGVFHLAIPDIAIDAQGISLAASATLRTRHGSPPNLQYQVHDVRTQYAHTQIAALRNLPAVPPGMLTAKFVDGSLEQVRVLGVDAFLPVEAGWPQMPKPDTVMQGGDFNIHLADVVRVLATNLRLAASTDSSFLGPMLGPSFAAKAHVEGGFTVDEQGFAAQGLVFGQGKMSGFDCEHVQGEVRVQAGAPGQALVGVDIQGVQAQGYGGTVAAPQVQYRMLAGPNGEPVHAVDGRFSLEHVSPSGLLGSEGVGMKGPVVQALQGALSGDVSAAVRVVLDPRQQPSLDIDVALSSELSLLRQGDSTPFVHDIPALELSGGLEYSEGPGRGPLLRVHNAWLRSGVGREASKGPGHSWVKADGQLALAGGDMTLQVSANIADLSHILTPLGVRGVGGSLQLTPSKFTGDFEDPHVLGALSLNHVTYRNWEIRSARAQLGFNKGILSLGGLQVDSNVARVSAQVHAKLINQPGERPTHQSVSVDALTVDGVELGTVLPRLGVRDISGQANLSEGRIRFDLEDIRRSMVFDAHIALRQLKAQGYAFPKVSAVLAIHGPALVLHGLEAQLWNGEMAQLSGEFHTNSGKFAAILDLPEIDLATLPAIAQAQLPLRGVVQGHVELTGDRKGVEIDDSTIEIRGLGWDHIDIGDADLDLGKAYDGPLEIRSDAFFKRFKLLSGSEVAFDGSKPQTAVLKFSTSDRFDPFVVLGRDKPAMVSQVQLEAETEVDLDLRPGKPLWRVKTTVPRTGIDLDIGNTQHIRNVSPMEIWTDGQGVTIGSTFIESGREQLEICGQYLFGATAEQAATLTLAAAGTLDVPRLGTLAQTLAALDLRLDLLPDGELAKNPRTSCLISGQNKGRLLMQGPLNTLQITGAVQSRAGHVAMRGFGHEITIAAGGQVKLTSSDDGILSVNLPREASLTGTFDEGRWGVWGKVELRDFLLPTDIDLDMTTAELPWSVPKEYAVAISSHLQLTGTHIQDEAKRDMTLSGTVDVHDGRYFKSFDNLGGVFGNGAVRNVESFSKPLKESMPWLGWIDLDLTATAEQFDLATRIPLGKAELATKFGLHVTGTMFDIRLQDRVEVLRGSASQIVFKNIAFDVVQATLDFRGDPTRPVINLEMKADVPIRSANVASRSQMALGADLDTTTQNDIVVITVKAQGVYGDPNFKLEFSSNQGDSPDDIQYILLTGKRRNDVGGAPQISTAALLGNSLNEGTQRVRDVVKSVFGLQLDAVRFNIDYDPTSGNATTDWSVQLGRQISVAAKVLTGREEARYSATVAFRMSDNLSFNGLWRHQQLTVGGLAEQPVDQYDFKLRFKVPLD